MSIVNLAIPAQPGHVALARSAAASLAAHAGFTIDRIDDVRLAIDEAVALAIGFADLDRVVGVEFELRADGLNIRVRVATSRAAAPSTGTFAWTVLAALVDDLNSELNAGALLISLAFNR